VLDDTTTETEDTNPPVDTNSPVPDDTTKPVLDGTTKDTKKESETRSFPKQQQYSEVISMGDEQNDDVVVAEEGVSHTKMEEDLTEEEKEAIKYITATPALHIMEAGGGFPMDCGEMDKLGGLVDVPQADKDIAYQAWSELLRQIAA